MKRNSKILTSYKVGIVATIFWPLPLLALNFYQYLGLASSSAVNQVLSERFGFSGLSGMLIVGTIVYLLFNRILWGTGASIQSEKTEGTLEPLLLSPSNRMIVLLANGFSSLIEGSWWIVAIFAVSWAMFGIEVNVRDWFAVAISLASTMVALVALGVFFAGFFIVSRVADQLSIGLQSPIRYFSGVSFPVSALPIALQAVSYALPITYGIEALRTAVLKGESALVVASLLWPLYLLAVLLIVLGYLFLRSMESRAKTDGRLYEI